MGGFYGSVQVRGIDRDAVKDVVEKLVKKFNIHFLLGPKLGGWVAIYPEGGDQDNQIGRELARKLRADQFQLIVHDDDLFVCSGRRGERSDSSRPARIPGRQESFNPEPAATAVVSSGTVNAVAIGSGLNEDDG